MEVKHYGELSEKRLIPGLRLEEMILDMGELLKKSQNRKVSI